MEVTTDEFKEDTCPSMKKYLYVEYKCIDRSAFKTENMIVRKIRLASESTPGRGFVELLEDSKPNTWQRLCINNMRDIVKGVICRTLGYSGVQEEQSSVGSGQEDEGNLEIPVLHGNVYCNSQDNNVSSCCLEKVNSEENSCSTMARVSCAICSEPVLSSTHDPVVVYSASNSLPGYSAEQAAMSSDSTWCARDSPESHDYLKLDLGEAYVITQVAILGAVPRGNWVTAYEMLYSKDEADWLPGIANAQNRLPGNSASDELSSSIFDSVIHARFIKVFPKSWQGHPCLKLEICGHKLLPAAPTNFTLRRLTAYTADLTWIKPADTGDGQFTHYQISLLRDGKLDSNITTQTGSWHFTSLRPYTKYSVVVQAGNDHGYGQETELTFRTNSTAPTAPPLDIKLSPISSTSFSISWKAPPSFYRNGIITGYEVCFAWVKSDEHCDRIIRTTATSIRLGYLSPATQYKVKVLARNDAGSGHYSEEYFQITNAEAAVCNRSSITSETFVVKPQKPREEVRFCQVLVLALSSDESFPGEHLFSAEAVTYLDASGSSIPYITAEFRASDFDKYQDFTVGDRVLFPALSMLNNNNSQAKKYFNGPLTPNTRYTVFQRFLSDKKLLYSSDFLAPVKTSEVKTPNTSFQAQCVSSVTTFKIPFVIMTVFLCVLLFIIACYFVLKWRRRQHETGKTKDKTKRATTDEKIPMNDKKDNNNELTTA
ncbi:receptor-type tyrosine- phosphatase F-like [Paramuricea clavata]|uniref:Receptor-type tyrosine- phosphatase F-like n=1 Tax=Paramuricea clavata TaxID=317549 RepID=A0A6S7HTP0_PARCT|nr:receptor-type tyrosine- phosphatase F-like [Paramuricea clavata]